MKIVQIDPSLFTWPYDSELIEALRANGHEVTLVAKHLSAGEQGKGAPYLKEFFYPGLNAAIVKKLPRPLFLTIKGLMHIVGMAALYVYLHALKPDVIHFQWAPLPPVDRLFVRLFRRSWPLVLTVHDSNPFNNNPSARLQRMGAIEIMHGFDRLIVHTEQARKRLLSYGIDETRIAQIAHGCLGGMVTPSSDDNNDRPANARPLTLLLFGQVKPYKGVDVAIKALSLLPPAVRGHCRLRVAGKPMMDVAPLRQMALDLGVDDSIQWDLRFIADDELPGLFAATDITVLPYREIDASGVLMAALSVGRPILASRIGLFAELLEDGKHGFLVPQDDPAALAAALERLVADDATRAAMAANVRALAAAIPSWGAIATQTATLYQSAQADRA